MSKPQLPEWYKAALAASGIAPRAEAEAAIAAVIREHPEYVSGLIARDAHRETSRWLDAHASSGDLLQASLFPDLPARMRVTPNKTVEVGAMTAADLDKARNILLAQTQNAIDGATDAAERKRAVFTDFYDQVRPLLKPGRTVRDVMPDLATSKAA
jgi:hypothetical protein